MLLPIIAGSVLVALLITREYFRRRPPEMSVTGNRHFRLGLLFAVISSFLYLVLTSVFAATEAKADTPLFALGLVAMAGNACNLVSAFSFLREFVRPDDIAPEGMALGLLMCIGQVVWVLSGILVAISKGF